MLLCRGPRTVVPVPGLPGERMMIPWAPASLGCWGACSPPGRSWGLLCAAGVGREEGVQYTSSLLLIQLQEFWHVGGGQFTPLVLSCAEDHSVTPETLSDLRLCVFSILNEGWCF